MSSSRPYPSQASTLTYPRVHECCGNCYRCCAAGKVHVLDDRGIMKWHLGPGTCHGVHELLEECVAHNSAQAVNLTEAFSLSEGDLKRVVHAFPELHTMLNIVLTVQRSRARGDETHSTVDAIAGSSSVQGRKKNITKRRTSYLERVQRNETHAPPPGVGSWEDLRRKSSHVAPQVAKVMRRSRALQAAVYDPDIWDLDSIVLNAKEMSTVEMLAQQMHESWAQLKINGGQRAAWPGAEQRDVMTSEQRSTL